MRYQTGFGGMTEVDSIVPDLTPSDELHKSRPDFMYPMSRPISPAVVAKKAPVVFPHHHGSKFERVPYWQDIPRWKDVTEEQFMSYEWNKNSNIQGKDKLVEFLKDVLPETFPTSADLPNITTRDTFLKDVIAGIDSAPMAIRLTPHILSLINWNRPLDDPMRRQFIPMKSALVANHPKLTLDSLHESLDSPCLGLVHRYPDKVLFLATSVCPLYCRFCTRSYEVGGNTETVTKKRSAKPSKRRWDIIMQYIQDTPAIQDVVISGGDSYYLTPEQLTSIGERLLNIPHIRRFRFATKGLAVTPSRILDPNDPWIDSLINISNLGRKMGKHVAVHTHFNHPNEFSWVTREAAQKLFVNNVTVRNQSVLLKGVNDNVETMGSLIRELADNNIKPYYVYQGDMVKGVEDLRTPLSTILKLETEIRGTIAGFMMPQFVVDLPGGGGKRLAASYQSYDRKTGISTFVAPAVKGRDKENKVYEYFDPLHSLPVVDPLSG
ncbi:L-lysine 2,3-aminomutase [Lachnellula suecica]|uniref:L-lysine 2,3-aminomutase n=1 Tax=Lachnellula suecica TaxID=602035 RepID=A0A8T9C9F6_9HELO|nr:L-lysine 2,3-aminomutase [Lachnellula suecica]